MNASKFIMSGIAIIIILCSYAYKDNIHQAYLQHRVNPKLEVQSGVVLFCGTEIEKAESIDELIVRITDNYSFFSLKERVGDIYRKNLIDTIPDEISDLSQIKRDWGYESNDDLKKSLDTYTKWAKNDADDNSYWAKRVKEIKKTLQFRKESGVDIDKINAELEVLRKEHRIKYAPVFIDELAGEYTAAACVTDNKEYIDAIGVWNDLLINHNSEQREKVISENIDKTKIHLKEFTETFISLVTTDAKIKHTDVSLENDRIITQSALIEANVGIFKRVFLASCSAFSSDLPSVVNGSGTLTGCELKEKGSKYSDGSYFGSSEITIGHREDQVSLDAAKKAIIKDFIK